MTVESVRVLECGLMEEAEPVVIRWKICPAKIFPKKAFFGWLVIIIVGFMISTTSLVLGLCLTAVLIATQATFLFSSTFSITEDGIVARYPLRKKEYTWKQIKRIKFFHDACYLFRRRKPSNLDGWSGIPVFYGENREAVIAAIQSHMSGDVVT